MKYHNFKFPELSSKLQVFNKGQTRKKSFQDVLDTILKYAEMYPEKRQDFLQSILIFLLQNIKNKGKPRIFKTGSIISQCTLDSSSVSTSARRTVTEDDGEELFSDDSQSYESKGISISGIQNRYEDETNTVRETLSKSKLENEELTPPCERGQIKRNELHRFSLQSTDASTSNTPAKQRISDDFTFRNSSQQSLTSEKEIVKKEGKYTESEEEILKKSQEQIQNEIEEQKKNEQNGETINQNQDENDNLEKQVKENEQNLDNTQEDTKDQQSENAITSIDDIEFEEEKISNFNYKMQFKFYYKDDFDSYYVKFKGHDMLLFSKIHDSNFSKLICFHGMIIKKSETEENLIEMYHEYDFKPIQIKTSSQKRLENLIQQFEEYSKKTKIDSTNSFSSIGKLVMFVNRCQNMGIPSDEPVLMKIRTNHFVFESSVHIHTQNGIHIKQEFSIPISNPFETIYIEFYHLVNDSWLRKKLKEHLIGRAKFYYSDIISKNGGYVIKNMILQIEQVEDGQISLKKTHPLKVSVRNDSNRLSIFAKNPQRYEEGEKRISNIDLFIISIYRFRRIIGYIAYFFQLMEDVYYFKYPKLSNLYFLFILLYIVFCEVSNIFTHIFLLIAFTCLSFQKDIRLKIQMFFSKYLTDRLNRFYDQPQFLTDDEDLFQQMRNSFDKINTQKIVVEDNDGENLSYLQKYYNLKKKFYQIHNYITTICNVCEKLKNLYTWKDPIITTYLVISLFLLCIIIHALPIRLFLIIVVCVIFEDGRKALEVRRKINKQIALNVCEYSLRKNLQLSKDQIDLTKQWPKNDKLYKQIVDDFYQHLQVIISEASLKIYDCPVTLSEELSKCTTTLILYAGDKIQANDVLFEEIRKQIYPKRSLVENIYYYSYNFLYNIPSDYYRLICPNQIEKYFEMQEIKKKEQDEALSPSIETDSQSQLQQSLIEKDE